MRTSCSIASLLLVFLLSAQARAYLVGFALPLDQLTEESDLIVKVQAIATNEVKDEAFPDYANLGFAIFATRLKVISVIKGDVKLAEIAFHHYDDIPVKAFGRMFSPQVYHFVPERCYILFAKKTDDPAVFRTFAFNHTTQPDQGLVLAADAIPLAKDISVKEAIWHELAALAASKDPADVVYAVQHLDLFSNAPRPINGKDAVDLPRNDAVDIICPLLAHKDPTVVTAALQAIGPSSPYWWNSQGWLATIGKGQFLRRGTGLSSGDRTNPTALRCRTQLITLANSSAAAETRAQAIRSLGRSRENDADTALVPLLRTWTMDDEPAVRAAAAVLWSDYPSKEAVVRIHSLAADQSPIVRSAAAYSIGCSQLTELLSTLDAMLDDAEEGPRRAAGTSLLSFDLKRAGEILKARLHDDRYFVPFANALAEADPETYRDDLVTIILAKPGAETIPTGQMPEYTAWQILGDYIMGCDLAEIRSGKLDKYLDALETPPNIGSSPFQTLYRFYHDHNLTERMKSFREKAVKQVTTYDLDYYFKQIDGRQ